MIVKILLYGTIWFCFKNNLFRAESIWLSKVLSVQALISTASVQIPSMKHPSPFAAAHHAWAAIGGNQTTARSTPFRNTVVD